MERKGIRLPFFFSIPGYFERKKLGKMFLIKLK